MIRFKLYRFGRLKKIGMACAAIVITPVFAMWLIGVSVPAPIRLNGHEDSVTAVAFSPNGRILASASYDSTVILWDTRNWNKIATLKPPDGQYLGTRKSDDPPMITTAAFSPNGEILAVGSIDDAVRLWDINNRKEVKKIQLPPGGPFGKGNLISCVEFSTNGRTFATATGDGIIRQLSVSTGKVVSKFKKHKEFAYSVAFLRKEKLAASCGADKLVKIWHIDSGKTLRTLAGHTGLVKDVAFSPNGQLLASCAGDVHQDPPVAELKLWEVATGKFLFDFPGHKGSVKSVAFSPDARLLAAGGGNAYAKYGEVLLWDVEKRKLLRRLTAHESLVNSVAFSPNGEFLASGSADNTVHVWRVKEIAK